MWWRSLNSWQKFLTWDINNDIEFLVQFEVEYFAEKKLSKSGLRHENNVTTIELCVQMRPPARMFDCFFWEIYVLQERGLAEQSN